MQRQQQPSDTQRFLDVLFHPSEALCLAVTPYETELTYPQPYTKEIVVKHSRYLINEYQRIVPNGAEYASINPLRLSRKDAHVTDYRNYLIEMDEGTIEEQYARLHVYKVPYTTLVYSGGKSLHAIISLEKGVTREEYRETAALLTTLLRSDKTSVNPSRFTRLAGAIRADTGKEQELVELRKKCSKENLMKFFTRNAEELTHLMRKEASRRAHWVNVAEGGEPGELAEETKRFIETGETKARSRHLRMVALAFELRDAGKDFDEALALCEQAATACGIIFEPKRANEAYAVCSYAYGK